MERFFQCCEKIVMLSLLGERAQIGNNNDKEIFSTVVNKWKGIVIGRGTRI